MKADNVVQIGGRGDNSGNKRTLEVGNATAGAEHGERQRMWCRLVVRPNNA